MKSGDAPMTLVARTAPCALVASSVRCAGLTATELLVTMAVAAILLVVGVPSFSAAILSTRLNTQMSDFHGALQRARSEAITRASPVTVCKSASGTACTSAGGWEGGWIVFIDGNANGLLDAGETIVRVTGALLSNYTLRGSTGLASVITYKPDGSAQASGYFILCQNNTTSHSRGINVNLVGRISNSSDADANGIPEDDAGVDYTTCTP